MSDFYESENLRKMGMRSLLNVDNWSTLLGGSYLEDEVIEVMSDVAKVFCDMEELLSRACNWIADLCKVDAAYITSGAAAGIVVSTAACKAYMNSNNTKCLYFMLLQKIYFCFYGISITLMESWLDNT